MPDALQFLILTVAARLNRDQQAAPEYLKRENEYLLEQLPPGRLRFTDPAWRRLASAAKEVGRAGRGQGAISPLHARGGVAGRSRCGDFEGILGHRRQPTTVSLRLPSGQGLTSQRRARRDSGRTLLPLLSSWPCS